MRLTLRGGQGLQRGARFRRPVILGQHSQNLLCLGAWSYIIRMVPPHLRALETPIAQDLERKMVFLGGPRQVGKTTLARRLMGRFPDGVYLNWDSRPDRKRMVKGEWPPEARLVVLDELHKQTGWKSLLKGHWDTRTTEQSILVTGSSRLDVFRRGGDSLMGRYSYWRMHPFTAAEMDGAALPATGTDNPPRLRFEAASRHIQDLFRLGGFPEPLLSGEERTLNRWRASRLDRTRATWSSRSRPATSASTGAARATSAAGATAHSSPGTRWARSSLRP